MLLVHRVAHVTRITTNEARPLCGNLESTVVIQLIFERYCVILLLFLLFDLSDHLFVFSQILLLVSDHVTELHLLFDQVFSLSE